ncbi:hypothetical protein [Streptomyces sp. NPDC054961]
MAHTSMVQRTLSDLSPAGAHASRNALLELAKGLILDAGRLLGLLLDGLQYGADGPASGS